MRNNSPACSKKSKITGCSSGQTGTVI
ncbi:hypothetical protein Zm00014a_030192 [Zea mays]|uniref:Uncharacterized protein n=1 Tax=Zea mays TaxID=4577 RepID=A0A3L6DAW6_MAIZE|nr:hypothetical protein Zm00014a_030192 [Zea mays]